MSESDAARSVNTELREIRRRVQTIPGLTVRKLLARAGVSASTWWRWEQFTLGRPTGQVPRMDRIGAIKDALTALEAEYETNGRQPVMSGFIYLASAYTNHPAGREGAFRAACIATASIIQAGRSVFSPIAHSHPVSEHGVVDAKEHGLWMEADRPLLLAAHEVWVLCDTHGAWRQSVGVQQEIDAAEEAGTPVRYLIPQPRIHEEAVEQPILGYELESAEPAAA